MTTPTSPSHSLPTPRQLLTSILNTLTKTPTSVPQPPPTDNILPSSTSTRNYNTPSSNPLTNIPSSARTLLTTLHVIFPPPTLLQALDLLDRGLITRIVDASVSGTEDVKCQTRNVESEANTTNHERNEQTSVYPPQAPQHLPPLTLLLPKGTDFPALPSTPPRNSFFLVRSSQTSRGRGKYGGGGSDGIGTVYTVRLSAWNCSCAAFVFSAFPGGGTGGGGNSWREEGEYKGEMGFEEWEWEDDGEELDVDGGVLLPKAEEITDKKEGTRKVAEERRKPEWEFGGLSLDGKAVGDWNVPVCKHILACLLAERWDGVLGRYVKVREVSKDEMAGFGGEG